MFKSAFSLTKTSTIPARDGKTIAIYTQIVTIVVIRSDTTEDSSKLKAVTRTNTIPTEVSAIVVATASTVCFSGHTKKRYKTVYMSITVTERAENTADCTSGKLLKKTKVRA